VRDWCARVVARYRVLAVLIGTAAAFGCALTPVLLHKASPPSVAELTIAAVAYAGFAAVAIARVPSWLLVAIATAGALASMGARVPDLLMNSALLIAVLVFSFRSELAPAVAGTVAAIAVLGLGHLLSARPGTGLSDIGIVPWLAAMAAVSQVFRARRTQRAMVAERARRAEETREQEARRRAGERVRKERLRIARELHDAVGHQVALISVQAGAMGYLLGTDPDKAQESLSHIQQASASALDELRMTVGLLRQPGDSEPVEPAAGLGRLDELIGSFTATGLRVSCEVTGQSRPLPDAVDLTAYRVIQESLTNTAKHAAGASASVRIAFRPATLALAIDDDGPGQGASGDEGHGIIGMRERAAAVGGWVSAGPRDGGGFRVLAELPVPASPAPASPAPARRRDRRGDVTGGDVTGAAT
jgi:signal transduction histidine kinase